jgi:aspartate carbamoyltransferase catalytic subunit
MSSTRATRDQHPTQALSNFTMREFFGRLDVAIVGDASSESRSLVQALAPSVHDPSSWPLTLLPRESRHWVASVDGYRSDRRRR